MQYLSHMTIYILCGYLINHVAQSGVAGNPQGVMANVLDCSLKISEFKLQFHYYIDFLKRYETH